jgi:hypothetical protein
MQNNGTLKYRFKKPSTQNPTDYNGAQFSLPFRFTLLSERPANDGTGEHIMTVQPHGIVIAGK